MSETKNPVKLTGKDENLLNQLTQREKEVAEHILLGKSNRSISEDMVKFYAGVTEYRVC